MYMHDNPLENLASSNATLPYHRDAVGLFESEATFVHINAGKLALSPGCKVRPGVFFLSVDSYVCNVGMAYGVKTNWINTAQKSRVDETEKKEKEGISIHIHCCSFLFAPRRQS